MRKKRQFPYKNLGLIALVSEAKHITIPNKHLEKVEKLHVASLMHKLLSSAISRDLLYGSEKRVTEEEKN